MSTPVLKTKLFITKPSPGLVKRERIIEKMNTGLAQNLILILAPAGFGKSTILSEWADTGTIETAWLSIDEADNDLKRFFSYLIMAVQEIDTSIGEDVVPALQLSDSPPMEYLLTLWINDLADHQGDVALVLDDYHLIENDAIHKGLQFLVEHAPRNFHLIVASRVTPPFPLARLRGRGQVTEIRVHDLRFSIEEAKVYLHERMNLDLSEPQIQAIHERTEGWITGLHLAALSIQNIDDKEAFISKFSGSHQYVLDYLVGEVLSQQPEEIRTVLLRTSILGQFNAALCDAVVETKQGRELLRRIRDAQLFLIPLDEQGEWYRYHHLFADFLYQRLTEQELKSIPDLHIRASQWLESNNFLPDAIRHAIKGQDYTRAAALIERIGPEMMMQNRFDQLARWLEAIPEEVVFRWPWLCIIWGWMNDRWGQFDIGEKYLSQAENSLEEDDRELPEKEEQIIRGQVAAIRALYALKQGKIDESIHQSNLALEFIPPGYFNRGVAWFSLGWAKSSLGDLAGAQAAYEEGYKDSVAANNRILAQVIVMGLGNLYHLQGRLHRAADTFREAIEYRYESSQLRIPYASTASINLGRILLEWNMTEEALACIHDGLEIATNSKIVDAIAQGHAVEVEIQLARGDLEGAKSACDRADQMRRTIPYLEPVTITRTLSSRANCLLAKGEISEALKTLRDGGLSADEEPEYHSEFKPRILARALIHSGRHASSQLVIAEAQSLLRKVQAKAEANGFTYHLIEALKLQALAFAAEGNEDDALRVLEKALSLAEPENYVQMFVIEGEPMEELLRTLDGKGVMHDYTRSLLTVFQGLSETGSGIPTKQLVEPLSQRELEVLALLQSELTGPEISDTLVISLNTLRTHTKNIYAKLEVNNRRAAVQKAREFHLI